MPLAECPEPHPSELAISDPSMSALRIIVSDLPEQHEAHWLQAYHSGEGGYRQLGGGLVNLIRDHYNALDNPGSDDQVRQRSAEFLSAMGLSMLLRTEAFENLPLAYREEQPNEPGMAELLLDVYAPDSYAVHAGQEFLERLPDPQDNPADTWYATDADGGLFVHRQQPPVPSADALEQNAGVFDDHFYNTFATLTPFPALPTTRLPPIEDLLGGPNLPDFFK